MGGGATTAAGGGAATTVGAGAAGAATAVFSGLGSGAGAGALQAVNIAAQAIQWAFGQSNRLRPTSLLFFKAKTSAGVGFMAISSR